MQPEPINPNQPASGLPAAPVTQPTPAQVPLPQPVVEPVISAPLPQAAPAPELLATPEIVQAPQPIATPTPVLAPEPVFIAPTVQPVAPQSVSDVVAPQVVSSEPIGMVSPANTPAPAPKSSSKGKIFKIIGVLVGAVVLLGVVGVVAIGLTANKQIVYKASDLTKVTTKTYSVSYAKQWTDLSANKSVLNYLKTSLGSDTSLVDQKVYGYKYNPKTDQGQTLLLVADTPLGVNDGELKQGLADPTAKQQFEASFKDLTGSLDSDNLCQSVSGKHETSKYDTSKYLVEVKADVDCNYTKANQAKYGTKGIHQVIFLGIKNGNTYLATLVASQTDWAKNSTFYNDSVLSSLNPL